MGDITGFGGNISLGTAKVVINATEWSATLSNDVDEVPAAFGENWKTHSVGPASFSGSVNGKVPTATTAGTAGGPFVLPTAGANWESTLIGTATLTADTGSTITGTMVFSNIRITRRHAKYAEMSADFANANTDLAITWGTTA